MLKNIASFVFAGISLLTGNSLFVCQAEDPVKTPRPIPATRPEMKELLENMKVRGHRIPLPELTDEQKKEAGSRATSYEAQLRAAYVPAEEGSVFGAGRPRNAQSGAPSGGNNAPRPDFTRNADENMTLSYQFKTMLFWIVSRTNNCQYCLGHQEWKLSATGMNDDAIAALDSDWSAYSEKEQAAFAYARLLTYEPHRLSDSELEKVLKHYTPAQVLEMTMSVSGNNSINRWKEGTGIPQSSGNTFAGRGGASSAEHSDSFETPTSEKFTTAVSVVAPFEVRGGKPSGNGVSNRPTTEARDEVLAKLDEAKSRSSRLPLIDAEKTVAWITESGFESPSQNWLRLIANFPNEGRGRLPALLSRERRTGLLTELQKAQINWITARQDRAWYAVGQAMKKLRSLGQSEDEIFALDGDWSGFSQGDRALFQLARHLAASPIALTDGDVEVALKSTSPGHVVQTVNHVAGCAYFNRVTEAAGLPIED
ncbi:MAG: carboxymuconolactone decarboxylase family protein [Planctomyces sp.]|nr:carboxymuconolactone decarboxylase family protein [Planctomyces sp.]